jgi:hypothetical protein
VQIVDERGQAELGADIFEAAHQERARVYPLLYAAEGMLDDLAATVENLGPPFETFGHAIERVLVCERGTPSDRRSCIVRSGHTRQAFRLP